MSVCGSFYAMMAGLQQ